MTAAGIDVGKASLDLPVDGHAGEARFTNDRAGITWLIKRLRAPPPPQESLTNKLAPLHARADPPRMSETVG